MYNYKKANETSLNVNQAKEGETIEKKVRRIFDNKEPITDGAPLVFTERKDGVLPQYDIRTDKFEVAVEAQEKVHQANVTRRKKAIDDLEKKNEELKNKEGGAQSTPATGV